MSEDLDSFFAKRKTKASKKKGAIKLDEVAQSLEQTTQFGSDEVEAPTANSKEPTFFSKQEEDAEWIQYDAKPAVENVGIGVFNYNEQVEQEYIAEERQQQAERAKTWQKQSEPEPIKEESPQPVVPEPPKQQPAATSAPAPYKPPNTRSNYQPPSARAPVHKLDIGNEELFPSLGQADQIEKEDKPAPKPKAWATPDPPAPQPITQQKEQTPERPAVEQRPPEDPVQRPSSDVRSEVQQPEPRRFEPDHPPRQQFGGGYHRDERPRQPPQQQTGPRGTGVFNARGEEIMATDRAPSDQGSWRRQAGNTVRETTRQRSPPQPENNADRHQPAPPKPETTNWRAKSRPLPPLQQQRQEEERHHQRRDHRQERRNEPDNRAWRREDPKPQVPPPVQQQQPEQQTWRKTEDAPPAEPAQNWRSEGGAPESDDWQTVSVGRNRRNDGPKPPRQGDNRRPPQQKSGTYVPPNRR